jgi:hypothetical protein
MLACMAFCFGCDTLEDDTSPTPGGVEVTNNKVYTWSGNSAYIDLSSMVKSSENVRFDITSQPKKGNLTAMGGGLLQYKPASMNMRRDAFSFSVYTASNKLIKTDSVVIIVEDDSTSWPVGFYPKDDSVYVQDSLKNAVVIPVLANDYLSGDSTDIKVEIYRPDNSFPPYFGNAVVLSDNTIRYTPGSNFPGRDKIMYRVYSTTNPSLSGIAMVFIYSSPKVQFCKWLLRADSITIDSRKFPNTSDTAIYYNVIANDTLCYTETQYTFAISKSPSHGSASINEQGILKYYFSLADTLPRMDSLRYEVCTKQQCKSARVTIRLQ